LPIFHACYPIRRRWMPKACPSSFARDHDGALGGLVGVVRLA
jgi:hypothetical protein